MVTAGPGMQRFLTLDEVLLGQSRVPTLAGRHRVRAAELATLLGLGICAAALTTFVHLGLRVPGHHIVFAVFPVALGLALVPRRAAGSVMGAGAAAGVVAFGFMGFHLPGPGALTSLLLTGPLLDVALRIGRRGVRLHLAFLLGGAAANAIAFVVRGATRAAGLHAMAGARPFPAWFSQAVWTYAAAGLVAGGVSALAWFHIGVRWRGERGSGADAPAGTDEPGAEDPGRDRRPRRNP